MNTLSFASAGGRMRIAVALAVAVSMAVFLPFMSPAEGSLVHTPPQVFVDSPGLFNPTYVVGSVPTVQFTCVPDPRECRHRYEGSHPMTGD